MALLAASVLAALPVGGVAAAVGVPSSGKTSVVLAAVDAWPRVVVFDPYGLRDRANARAGHTERAPWWPHEPLLTLRELAAEPEALDRAPLRLVVAPDSLEPARMGRDFATLIDLLWNTHGVSLVAEECGLYSRAAAEAINRVSTGGAHAGMRLVLLAQRLGRIQKDAREGLTVILCGAQGAPEDIADLRTRCGATFAERVRALRPPVDGKPQDPPIAWKLGEGLNEVQSVPRARQRS